MCGLSIKTYPGTCSPALWVSPRSVCLVSHPVCPTCLCDITVTIGSRKPLATWATVFDGNLHSGCAHAVHQDIVKTQSRIWECFMPFPGSDKIRHRQQDSRLNKKRNATFAFWTYLLSIFTNKNLLDLFCVTMTKIIFPAVCTVFKQIYHCFLG